MHDSLTIANRFLELAKEHDDSLTPMQVLKLVYIAHGWRLGLYGKPLIRDEIQAWQYGPVIPKLYNAMRGYRSNPVTFLLRADPRDKPLTKNERSVVAQVFDIYGRMSGPALSRLTHAPGTPWALSYEQGVFGIPISNDLIQDHYGRLDKEQDSVS